MTLVFFCSASSKTGMGHVLRCLALAQAAVAQEHCVWFVLDKAAARLVKDRDDWAGQILEVEENFCLQALLRIQKRLSVNIDWLVLDSYLIPDSFFQDCGKANSQVALFDDLHYQEIFHHIDLIINSALEADNSQHHYGNIPSHPRLALGSRFTLLRKEFSQIDITPLQDRQRLTLCFGGSDMHNLTYLVLEQLLSRQIDNPLLVVTGPAYGHLDKLLTLIEKPKNRLRVRHKHNVQNMADIWNQSRLAISAGGGAQFELRACQTPSILAVVADNQLQASTQSALQAWCKTLVLDENINELTTQIADTALSILNQPEQLLIMHEAAKKHANKDGAKALLGLLSDT